MNYLRRPPPPPRMLPDPRALLDRALDPLNPPPKALRLLLPPGLRDISRVPTRLALLLERPLPLRLMPDELIPDERLLTLGEAEPVRLPNEVLPTPDARWLERFPP